MQLVCLTFILVLWPKLINSSATAQPQDWIFSSQTADSRNTDSLVTAGQKIMILSVHVVSTQSLTLFFVGAAES